MVQAVTSSEYYGTYRYGLCKVQGPKKAIFVSYVNLLLINPNPNKIGFSEKTHELIRPKTHSKYKQPIVRK